jgi:class 3 adenylate cyclase
MQIDLARLSMTEIIRLQNLLSQELSRRFEISSALVFSDIAGSTAYFARFGDETGRKLQQLHLDLLEQSVGANGGRIVDTAGDGAFSAFPSATGAADAITGLLLRVSQANEHRTRDHQLTLRIGAHWGRVLSDGHHVTGDSVNLAARIATSADPGQIRLSRDLFQELGIVHRLQCRSIGAVDLKGLGRSIELLDLEWRDATRFPTAVRIRETGQLHPLPAQDIISFGRLEQIDGISANDIVLVLPDPAATRLISRWHFELRRRTSGYTLRPLSSQAMRVDGQPVPTSGTGIDIRPGSVVDVAGVMTLEFVVDRAFDLPTSEETMHIVVPPASSG